MPTLSPHFSLNAIVSRRLQKDRPNLTPSMKFVSTRGRASPLDFSGAVATGLAPDGGLFLPDSLPDISTHLEGWSRLPYAELSARFLGLFAADLGDAVCQRLAEASYRDFDHDAVAPLKKLSHRLYVLELFHGPTLAFKDFALQLLGNLYEEQIRRTGQPINVLVATSGDTGAAAIHGLLGKEGVNLFVIYPDGRISPLQERQMACTGARNVFPLAIRGSFDDAQRALKETFEDLDFRKSVGLSAVNSINLARIIAQCVYFLFAWFRLPAAEREAVEFVVPTGNFGNVFAGWLVQKMGLPVTSFKVATNQNDILFRLFRTGLYKVGAVQPSLAPSMDIQVASNFERFIYYAEGEEPARVQRIMEACRETGQYRFPDFDSTTFTVSRAGDDDILEIIERVENEFDYIVDPHTACAFKDIDADKTSIVLSTAHPAKFPETIGRAIGRAPIHPSLEKLKSREVVKYPMQARPTAIQEFIRAHAV